MSDLFDSFYERASSLSPEKWGVTSKNKVWFQPEEA
jgi:hypothetical protein